MSVSSVPRALAVGTGSVNTSFSVVTRYALPFCMCFRFLSLLSDKSLPGHVTVTVARHVTEGQEHSPLRVGSVVFSSLLTLFVGVGASSEASWSPQMWTVSQARCRAAHVEQV